MSETRLLVPVALLLLSACSRAAPDGARGARIVPEGLRVMPLPGGNGVLEVIALTLRSGTNGSEIYAALRNEGGVAACSAAFSVELFDAAEQSLAAGIGGLLTQHFYRLADGSGAIAACVGPGDVSMAAVQDLPPEVAPDDIATIVYRCPYFALDVVPLGDLGVRQLRSKASDAGVTFSGELSNGLDVALHNPSVSVFPVDRVGRPLGMAIASGTLEVPAGGRWAFETSAVDARGADAVAYPAGALAQ